MTREKDPRKASPPKILERLLRNDPSSFTNGYGFMVENKKVAIS
jgi:hypothetical protein